MNKYEWVPALDKALQDIVLRNYFNFDMVSLELNEETRRLGLNFGATHVFTNEKCRIRWSYLHLKVSFSIPFNHTLYRDKQENRSNTRISIKPHPKNRRRPRQHQLI